MPTSQLHACCVDTLAEPLCLTWISLLVCCGNLASRHCQIGEVLCKLDKHLSLRRTCSKPAVGFETKVAIRIAEEGFSTTGLMVTERNWLDVYPYANWGGNANLPVFQQGQQLIPQEIMLRQVRL